MNEPSLAEKKKSDVIKAILKVLRETLPKIEHTRLPGRDTAAPLLTKPSSQELPENMETKISQTFEGCIIISQEDAQKLVDECLETYFSDREF